jgi:hypothetical protein
MKQRLSRRKQVLYIHKYKEFALMTYLENTVSQHSLGMSPIWLPIIKEELKRIQKNGNLSYLHGEVNKL